jgi:hypothetical protein
MLDALKNREKNMQEDKNKDKKAGAKNIEKDW